MSDLQAKVEALGHLVNWRKSGRVLCNNSDKLDKEILELAEQIRKAPITLTMDTP